MKRFSAALGLVVVLAACGKKDPGSEPRDMGGDTAVADDVSIVPDGQTADDVANPPDMRVAPDAGDLGVEPDIAVDMGTPGFNDPAVVSGTRLRAQYLQAGLGADVVVGMWDVGLNASCSYATARDGNLRCLPPQRGGLAFADMNCTEPVALSTATTCPDSWLRDRSDNAVWRPTNTPATLTGGLIYSRVGVDCMSYPVQPGTEYWVADPVPSSQFVLGTIEDAPRTDGLIARTVIGDDGSRLMTAIRHEARDYDCIFDAQQRCTPAQAGSDHVYADATCTQAVHPVYTAGLPPMLIGTRLDAMQCPFSVEYFEVGVVHSAPVYALNGPGDCRPYARANNATYYERGAQVNLPVASLRLEGAGDLQAQRRVDGNGDALGASHTFWSTLTDEACEGLDIGNTGQFACVSPHRAFVRETWHLADDPGCTKPWAVGIMDCARTPPNVMAPAPNRASCVAPSVLAIDFVWERGAATGPDLYDSTSGTCLSRQFFPTATAWETGPDITATLPTLQLLTD